MSRRLPPLNALRAFEAAARHASFSAAAAELSVTPAAISHQIKALEGRLGLVLFRRSPRAVRLTDAGQRYLAGVREGFDHLSAATDQLIAGERSGPLTVSLLASFAARWLMPRLKRFHARHPEIDVRLSTTQMLADFARDDVDLAIRFGRGRYPGLTAERLLSQDVFPVCSPALLDGPRPLRRPEDLKHHTLLHDDIREDWALWLQAAGISGVDPTRGPSFGSDSGLVVQAAVDGLGVALGRSALVAHELAAGRLVRPFQLALKEQDAYYVVYPPTHIGRPKVKLFRDWLLEEAAAGAAPPLMPDAATTSRAPPAPSAPARRRR